MSPKPLLLALALLLLSLPAMAQTDQPEDVFPANLFPSKAASPLSVGLFGGYTSNTHVIDVLYATDMKYTPASGFTAGATGSLHLTGWFSLRADAALVQKNWRYDRDNYSVTFVYTDATNTYFSLPVTAVVSLGRTFRLCGFFGGYVGYWLSGNRAGKDTRKEPFIPTMRRWIREASLSSTA